MTDPAATPPPAGAVPAKPAGAAGPFRWLGRLELTVLTILGVAATLIMFSNAVLRYLLGSSLIWSEEAIRILFVWSMFIAITAAFFRNEHIGFDNLVKKGGALGAASHAISALCLLAVGGILAVYGFRYTVMTGSVPLPATNLPTSLFMWPGVAAGAVWAVLGAARLWALAGRLVKGRTP
jgi:TRAP-type C4-dicarboxylate transport system permease small subunit